MFNKDSKSSTGSGNSFTIIQTDAGTSPTATSSSDTLTFTSSDASVTITGNSGTDTVDFVVSGGSGMAIGGAVTSGTTGSILFVGSGPVLAQDNSNLFFNDTTNRVGIGTNSLNTAKLTIAAGSGEYGIYCTTSSSDGIYMETDFQGVHGKTTGSTANAVGLYGQATAAGIGVEGDSVTGTGVYCYSTNSYGLWAESENGITAHFKVLNTSGTNANPTVVIEQNTSQTAVLQAWRNSSSSNVATMSVDGLLTVTNETISSFGTAGIVHNNSSGVLSTSLIVNADVSASAAIAYSKLNLSGSIVNADISASAAIARSKLASGTASHVLINDGSGVMSSEATLATSRGGTNIASYTTGDLIYATSSSVLSKLAIGTAATVLTSSGTAPQWQTLSSAGLAANTESYITIGNTAGLTAERALTGTVNQITITDNGANSTVVLSTPQNIHTGASPTFTGLTLSGVSTGAVISTSGVLSSVAPGTSGNVLTSNGTTWTSAAPTGGGAPTTAQYVTLALDGTLSAERVLTGTANQITITDGGANGNVTLSTPQNIHTAATPTFARLILTGSTDAKAIDGDITLNDATGNEIAYELDFTVNKATSGTTTGLKINMTDTSSPGTAYLFDLQKTASSKFRVDENGNLETSNITGNVAGITITGGTGAGDDLKLKSTTSGTTGNINIRDNILFDGTIFKTSASSFTIRDQINRDIIQATATDIFINDLPVTIESQVNINDNIVITQDVGSVSVSPAMTLTSAAHTGLTGETKDLYINLSATKTYAASTTVAQNRFLHIEAPVVTGPNTTTLTELSSVCIGGTPAVAGGSSVNVTTSIGFLLEQTTASQQISAAVGFVIYAPDIPIGSPTFAACGSFMDGVVGVGTLTPAAYLDVRVPSITASLNDIVCIDGVTRYSGMYLGGTSISVVNSGTACLLVDFGSTPTLSGNNSANGITAFYRVEGAVNYTGNTNVISGTLQHNTSGGTHTSEAAGIFAYNTVSGSTGAVTTGRSLRTTSTLSGSQTITTYAGLDQTFSNSGASSTVTTGHYIRMNAPTTTGTVTNWDALLIEANVMTVATRKCALRVLGTDHHSRHVPDIMFGQDAAPGATVDVNGKFFIAGASGLITKYNNIATVSGGVPAMYGTADITGQTAAKADTTLYTPAATGMFRISVALKVTTAATTSSTLGPVTIKYTSGDGSVAQTITMALTTAAGAVATTSTTNSTTTSTLSGVLVIHALTSVAITYAVGYASSGATAMQYSAHLKCEAM